MDFLLFQYQMFMIHEFKKN